MIIQYCSDLHLEMEENLRYCKRNPLVPEGDLLILAGDIVPFNRMDIAMDFFEYCAANFEETYWIPGNHEYYHADISARSGNLLQKIRENVLLVNNTTIEKGNTRLIFSTLWSNIAAQHAGKIENGMSDFRLIHNNGAAFTIDDFNAQHQTCFKFLEAALGEPWQGKTMVVTHHVPSFKEYPRKYRGSVLNTAFATELGSFIEAAGPDYWIYGHHHFNIPSFKIGKTTLLTNQLGYVHHHEHRSFSNRCCIEL